MRVMEVSTVVQSLLVSKRPDQIQTASKRVSVHPSSRADCPLKTAQRNPLTPLTRSQRYSVPSVSRVTVTAVASRVWC